MDRSFESNYEIEPESSPQAGMGRDAGFYQKRASRILTRVPELLDTLTRHWLGILACIVVGGVICWAKVLTEPLIYSGSATLMVNPSNTYLLAREGQPTLRSQDDFQRFLFAQRSLLRSDEVSRAFVKRAGLAESVDEEPADSYSARLRRKLKQAKTRVLGALGLENYRAREPTEEERSQKAAERFEKRSRVVVDPESSTIQLIILGADRQRVKSQLDDWIEAYRKHVEDMDLASGNKFLSERIDYYAGQVSKIEDELKQFKKENPNITEARMESLTREIATLEVRRDILSRTLDEVLLPGAPRGPGETGDASLDSEYARSLTLKADYERALIDRLAEGYTEFSPLVQELRRKIDLLDKGLKDREGAADGPEGSPDPAPTRQDTLTKQMQEQREDLQGRVRQQLADRRVELEGLLAQKSQLKEKLDRRIRIEQKYDNINEKKRSYELMLDETSDRVNSWKTVNIQISSVPLVSTEPYNKPPLLIILLGCAGGFAVGMFLAALYEVLCNKIRFKYDITEGYGLPIMAVVPEK